MHRQLVKFSILIHIATIVQLIRNWLPDGNSPKSSLESKKFKKFEVGAKWVDLKRPEGGRVLVYYPTDDIKNTYPDIERGLEGNRYFTRFVWTRLLEQLTLKFMSFQKIGVKLNAPLAQLNNLLSPGGKYTPVLFSHDYQDFVISNSLICKDLASKGHIVFCV